MASIAGLQDFRQEGPPADIGNYVLSSTAVGFKYVFSGTTYYTVIRAGIRGWVLVGGPSALPETAINAAFTALGAGARIVLQDGTYTMGTTGIVFTAINQVLEGQGRGTFLDGDALLTGNHVFSIITLTDCKISNLSLQTQDGAGKTCHGIFLNDGANRTFIENVTVINSDSDAIHIEGTNTRAITITNCHILGSDGYGIHVNADGGNDIQYMKIVENEIRDVLLDGMYFEGGQYVNFNQLIANSIIGAGKSGINGGTLYESILSDNTCISCVEHGILIASEWNDVIGNHCESNTLNGIYLHSSNINCVDNDCELNLNNGIWTDLEQNNITGNHCDNNTMHGIFVSDGQYPNIVGNYCVSNDTGNTGNYHGISLVNPSRHGLMSGNYCRTNHGYGINIGGAFCSVVGNYCFDNDQHGISLYYNAQVCVGNTCMRNSLDAAGTYHGINLIGTDYCTVVGNMSYGYNSQGCGIFLDTSSSDLIDGNMCTGNLDSGIKLFFGADNNAVTNNFCGTNTNYGISIANANCDNNRVQKNTLPGNGAPILDSGTGTILDSVQFQFQQGGNATGIVIAQFISAAGSAKGWEIDTAAEWAIALGTLPLEVQQVVRIKIWAVGLAAPGANNQMRTDFAINAGQPDEVYTGEVIAVASKESDQTNFDVNDVITWTLAVADDADIGHLIGGDCLETRVDYRAAVAPDIATDAVFRCVEIHFV